MQTVNLPTDNLYKFQAIAGIILTGAGALIPLITVMLVFERIDELKSSANQIDATLEHENAVAEIEVERFEFLSDLYSSIPKDELNVFEQIKFRDEIFESRTRFEEQAADRRRAISKIKVESQSIERYVIINFVVLGIGILLGVVGVTLAKQGFQLWHSRLQVYLDEEVKYRASSHDDVASEGQESSRSENNGNS